MYSLALGVWIGWAKRGELLIWFWLSGTWERGNVGNHFVSLFFTPLCFGVFALLSFLPFIAQRLLRFFSGLLIPLLLFIDRVV